MTADDGLPAGSDDPAVSFDGVSFTYATGAAPALSDVSLAIMPGELLTVIGPNGGGKSTLLKLMLGLLRPDAGRVGIFGMEPHLACARGIIGHVPQRSGAELAFPVSVRQVVSMPLAMRMPPARRLDVAARSSVERALRLVGAGDLGDRPIGALSGGQLQRVMIARALAVGPRILVLDEPTAGLDAAAEEQFGDLIATLLGDTDLTIVMVSHDVRAVVAGPSAQMRTRRVACLNRTVHFHAAPDGLTPAVLAEVFQHDIASVFGGDIHIHAHAAEDCPDPAGADRAREDDHAHG